jgi:HPt (histidine-containing phosphotransfer) domain-containing protein
MIARPQDAHPGARLLLATLWERNLPVLRDRLAELAAAVDAARNGTLRTEARESACSVAHKLAGSLGMFGYAAGTAAARRMEQRLDGDGDIDAEALALELADLQEALPLQDRD